MPTLRLTSFVALALMLAGVVLASRAQAQASAPAAAAPATAAPAGPVVGAATQRLLARQRSGADASATPRRIDAESALLSHQRLLDSFKHPIPEAARRLEPQGSGASSGGSGSR